MGPSFSSLLEFICRELLGSGPFFFGSVDLFCGLEPVFEIQAGLISAHYVEFIGSAPFAKTMRPSFRFSEIQAGPA